MPRSIHLDVHLSPPGLPRHPDFGGVQVDLEAAGPEGEPACFSLVFDPGDEPVRGAELPLAEGAPASVSWTAHLRTRSGQRVELGKGTAGPGHLLLSAPTSPEVWVHGGALDWRPLRAALVRLSAHAAGEEAPLARQVVLLTPDRQEARWHPPLDLPADAELRFTSRLVLHDHQVIPGASGPVDGQALVLPPPFRESVEVSVLPGNQPDHVSAVTVELAYIDEDAGYSVRPLLRFEPDAQGEWRQFRRHAIPILDPRKQALRARATVESHVAATRTSEWVLLDGDPVFAVPPARELVPVAITVDGSLLDYAATPLVKVDLRAAEAAPEGRITSLLLRAERPGDTVELWLPEGAQDGDWLHITDTRFRADGGTDAHTFESGDEAIVLTPRG